MFTWYPHRIGQRKALAWLRGGLLLALPLRHRGSSMLYPSSSVARISSYCSRALPLTIPPGAVRCALPPLGSCNRATSKALAAKCTPVEISSSGATYFPLARVCLSCGSQDWISTSRKCSERWCADEVLTKDRHSHGCELFRTSVDLLASLPALRAGNSPAGLTLQPIASRHANCPG